MKLNLIRHEVDFLTSYKNLSLFPIICNGTKTEFSDFINLDSICDDAEVTEIRAEDILDFMSQPQAEKAINSWIKKLRHGGGISIGGIDTYEVCRMLYQSKIDTKTANVMLRGDQTNPINFRKNGTCLIDMANYLQSRGLKIIKKILNNEKYLIVAQRS